MERVSKASMWLGVAASVVSLLTFFGFSPEVEFPDSSPGAPAPAPAPGGAATGGLAESPRATPGWDSGSDSESSDSGDRGHPTPDPTLEAYRGVNAGDCLHNWMTGRSTWSTEIPETIACGASGAALWVSYVSDTTSSCPSGPGQDRLSYTDDEGETVALCVTRRFKVGMCFLGLPDGGANLMSWVDCHSTSAPAPYSQIYRVTGVYDAPTHHTPGECHRTENDRNRYVSWILGGETALVCAVVHAS